MLRAISLRESWMREIRTSGLTRERAPKGPSLLYNSSSYSVFDGGSRLARKNHAKTEATSSLRARKFLNRRSRVCLRAYFKIKESKQTVFKTLLSKSSGSFRRSRRVLLPQPASLTNL